MNDTTFSAIIKKIQGVNLSEMTKVYADYARMFNSKSAASEFDKKILAFSAAKRSLSWAEEVCAYLSERRPAGKIKEYAQNIGLAEKLEDEAHGIIAKDEAKKSSNAQALDAVYRTLNAMPRSEQFVSQAESFCASWQNSGACKSLCKLATPSAVAALADRANIDKEMLSAEQSVKDLSAAKQRDLRWCGDVDALYAGLARLEKYGCRYLQDLKKCKEQADRIRLEDECARFTAVLHTNATFSEVLELNDEMPAHKASLVKLIPNFEKVWGEKVKTARLQSLAYAEELCKKADGLSDAKKRLPLYREAADLDLALAHYKLAYCYFNGVGVAQDKALGYSHAEAAVSGGCKSAQYIYGWCKLIGVSCNTNENEAFKNLFEAANLKENFEGKNHCYYAVGFCYQFGRGVTKNADAAVKYYLLSAKAGSDLGALNLARCYENGTGADKDEQSALFWYSKAVELGNGDAAKELKNLELAIKTRKEKEEKKRKAEEAAREKARLQALEEQRRKQLEAERKAKINALDSEFAKINAMPASKDFAAKADDFCARWQASDVKSGCVKATQTAIASLQKKVGAFRVAEQKRELDSRINHCYSEAKRGNADAMYELAEYYYNGNGVTRSYSEAAEWYEAAAKRGHTKAMEKLGDCYYYGRGVAQSYAKAEKWYKKSSKN